jgi:hypothetical protein
MIECGICRSEILKDDYRWLVSYAMETEIGEDGFSAEFCSTECFLKAVANVENSEVEKQMQELGLELSDGERDTVLWNSAALFAGVKSNTKNATDKRSYKSKDKNE